MDTKKAARSKLTDVDFLLAIAALNGVGQSFTMLYKKHTLTPQQSAALQALFGSWAREAALATAKDGGGDAAGFVVREKGGDCWGFVSEGVFAVGEMSARPFRDKAEAELTQSMLMSRGEVGEVVPWFAESEVPAMPPAPQRLPDCETRFGRTAGLLSVYLSLAQKSPGGQPPIAALTKNILSVAFPENDWRVGDGELLMETFEVCAAPVGPVH